MQRHVHARSHHRGARVRQLLPKGTVICWVQKTGRGGGTEWISWDPLFLRDFAANRGVLGHQKRRLCLRFASAHGCARTAPLVRVGNGHLEHIRQGPVWGGRPDLIVKLAGTCTRNLTLQIHDQRCRYSRHPITPFDGPDLPTNFEPSCRNQHRTFLEVIHSVATEQVESFSVRSFCETLYESLVGAEPTLDCSTLAPTRSFRLETTGEVLHTNADRPRGISPANCTVHLEISILTL